MRTCDRHPSALSFGRWHKGELKIALCGHCNRINGPTLVDKGWTFAEPSAPTPVAPGLKERAL